MKKGTGIILNDTLYPTPYTKEEIDSKGVSYINMDNELELRKEALNTKQLRVFKIGDNGEYFQVPSFLGREGNSIVARYGVQTGERWDLETGEVEIYSCAQDSEYVLEIRNFDSDSITIPFPDEELLSSIKHGTHYIYKLAYKLPTDSLNISYTGTILVSEFPQYIYNPWLKVTYKIVFDSDNDYQITCTKLSGPETSGTNSSVLTITDDDMDSTKTPSEQDAANGVVGYLKEESLNKIKQNLDSYVYLQLGDWDQDFYLIGFHSKEQIIATNSYADVGKLCVSITLYDGAISMILMGMADDLTTSYYFKWGNPSWNVGQYSGDYDDFANWVVAFLRNGIKNAYFVKSNGNVIWYKKTSANGSADTVLTGYDRDTNLYITYTIPKGALKLVKKIETCGVVVNSANFDILTDGNTMNITTPYLNGADLRLIFNDTVYMPMRYDINTTPNIYEFLINGRIVKFTINTSNNTLTTKGSQPVQSEDYAPTIISASVSTSLITIPITVGETATADIGELPYIFPDTSNWGSVIPHLSLKIREGGISGLDSSVMLDALSRHDAEGRTCIYKGMWYGTSPSYNPTTSDYVYWVKVTLSKTDYTSTKATGTVAITCINNPFKITT